MSLLTGADALVLVEDTAAAQALTAALTQRGHRVRRAASPAEALQSLQFPHAFLFVQIDRDVEARLALLRKVGGTADTLATYVFAVTANADERTQAAALASGADEVLELPVHAGRLAGRLAALERRWGRMRLLTVANRELAESRRLLETVFNAVPHRMFIKDRRRRYLIVNRAMAESLRRTPAEIIGKVAQDFAYFAPEASRLIDEADDRVLDAGLSTDVPEEPFFRPDGSRGVNRVIKVPVTDEAGDVIALAGIAEDITERKRAEEALRASQGMLRTIIDTLPMFVAVKDREGRYQIVNRRIAESRGLAPEDMVSRLFADMEHGTPEQRAWVTGADRRVLETGETVRIAELPVSRRPGHVTWESVIKLPLRSGTGEVVGIVTVGEDITERRRAEAERINLERQFQHAQKLESLGVLAGGIAHDFNNLLTGILGNAELALLYVEPGHQAYPPLEDIRSAGRRAAALTRQMLDYAGKGRVAVGPLHINATVEEIAQLLRVSIPRGVEVRYELGAGLPAVEADASQLQQVVMNLITNAAEAIGAAHGTITLSTGAADLDAEALREWSLDRPVPPGPYVYLEVRDTGVGMTWEVRSRIFEPFFTTKFTGRGLGLAAVLGIVHGHAGAIGIESEPGQGTAFRVWLPAAPEAAAPPAAASPPAKPSFSGRALVVDDEPMVRDVLRRQLEVLGFAVSTAEQGRQALGRYGDELSAFSLVLLDVTMPVLGGKETLRQIKRRRPDLPVILCSGFEERDADPEQNGIVPDGYLTKPVLLDSLRDVVRKTLRVSAEAAPRASES